MSAEGPTEEQEIRTRFERHLRTMLEPYRARGEVAPVRAIIDNLIGLAALAGIAPETSVRVLRQIGADGEKLISQETSAFRQELDGA